MLGLPSVKADSQALPPRTAAKPIRERVTPSPVRGDEDARGVLLNPIIQIPVGGWVRGTSAVCTRGGCDYRCCRDEPPHESESGDERLEKKKLRLTGERLRKAPEES
jgi:hypothetical protein